MKIKTLFIVSLLVVNTLFSQKKTSLKEQLYKSITPCYTTLKAAAEEELQTIVFDGVNNIDDSRNGYLKVSGSFPTCGCNCSNIAGAYKQANSNYTILINEEWGCSFTSKFYANRPLDKLLPKNFGIQEFITQTLPEKVTDEAIYKLKVEIPRKGTDTKVSLELIPFGLHIKSEHILVFEHGEQLSQNLEDSSKIKHLIFQLKYDESLQHLLNKAYSEIDKEDLAVIESKIDKSNSDRFQDMEEITSILKKLQIIYNLNNTIENEAIILDWDKNKSRFYIKEKIKQINKMSFKDFINSSRFWSPTC